MAGGNRRKPHGILKKSRPFPVGPINEAVQSGAEPPRKKVRLEAHKDSSGEEAAPMLDSQSPPWTSESSASAKESASEFLNQEILDFVSYVRPSEKEVEYRTKIARKIVCRLVKLFPDIPYYDITVVGSFRAGLWRHQSNINFAMTISELTQEPALQEIQTFFSEPENRGFAKIIKLDQGSESGLLYPKIILRTSDRYGNLRFDVTVNSPEAVAAANYVIEAIKRHPAVEPIVRVVTHVLEQQELMGALIGGLGCFELTHLVLHHLQNYPGLWNSQEVDPKVSQGQILGQLLVDFFDFYGNQLNESEIGLSFHPQQPYFLRANPVMADSMFSVESPINEARNILETVKKGREIKRTFQVVHQVLREAQNELAKKILDGSPIDGHTTLGRILRSEAKAWAQASETSPAPL